MRAVPADVARFLEALPEELPAAVRGEVRRAAAELAAYLAALLAANEKLNLMSASAARPAELVGRHVREALEGLSLLPPPGRRNALLDIGSGSGLPAVPLLLVRRDMDGTLVESTGKKARFLSEVCRELSLTASVSNARFPDSFPMTHTFRFDVLTSRAVADAGKLVRKARPLLRRGGRALLWTTERLFPEIRRSSGCGEAAFHKSSGAESRGIAVLESFT
jgi:16S rRNA (guanine(527)-N(7))-methyltransferase RsmG